MLVLVPAWSGWTAWTSRLPVRVLFLSRTPALKHCGDNKRRNESMLSKSLLRWFCHSLTFLCMGVVLRIDMDLYKLIDRVAFCLARTPDRL